MKKVSIHVLGNDPRISRHAPMVKKEATKAVKMINNLIPLAEVDIIIMHNPGNITFGMIAGQTDGCHKVYVALDVYHKNFKKTFKDELTRTLAHELYHTVRSRINSYPETLVENIVNEGLAIHFELEIAKKPTHPFLSSIKKAEFEKLFLKAKKEFFSKKFNWDDWHYGSKSRNIPKQAIYIVGHYIIRKYLENNPGVKASDLVSRKTKLFVEKYEKS